jgi:hypothetical protein
MGVPTGLNFGHKTIPGDFPVGDSDWVYWLSDDDKAAMASITEEKKRTAYVNKETGDEVNKDDCYVAAGDITTKDISYYKDTHDKRVYPKYATRDVLIGAERFLNVKGVADRVVKYGDIPTDKLSAMVNNTASYTTGGTTLTTSCTVSGTFTDKVVVKPPLDEDIYIRLNNVDFLCPEAEVDGKTEVTNTSYIEIDETESGTGHAYFVYDGFVTSNYDFDQDLTDTRLVKTVYDWMSGFKFDSTEQNNVGHEGDVYAADANLVDKDYEILEPQPSGPPKKNTVKIKNINTLPKEDGKYVIEKDATLVGEFSGNSNDVVVKAQSNADIWLTLDGTFNGKSYGLLTPEGKSSKSVTGQVFDFASVIVDDMTNKDGSGNVNIYIKGNVMFNENGAFNGISSKYITDTLITKKQKLNIVSRRDTPTLAKIVNDLEQKNDDIDTLKPLRTMIYAAEDSRLSLNNNAMVVGYIKAPKTLTVDVNNPSVPDDVLSRITYDGLPLSKICGAGKDASYLKEGLANRIAFIGMLNVLQIDRSDNDWFLLYDAPGGGGGSDTGSIDDAEGLHKYDSVEYVAYAR